MTAGLTPNLHDQILDSGPCHYCGSWWPDEVDHVIPRSRGGANSAENYVPACHRCNNEKSDMRPDEWQALREANGDPWPPPSREQIVQDVLIHLEPMDVVALAEMRREGSLGSVMSPEWSTELIKRGRRKGFDAEGEAENLTLMLLVGSGAIKAKFRMSDPDA